MRTVGKVIFGVLAAAGIAPAVAPDRWFGGASGNGAAVLAWELFVGFLYVLTRIVALPATRRLEQVSDALDNALGRGVSRYGRRYRQWVLDSRRFMEVRGLATVGDFTPELDEVFVDVSLAPGVAHRFAKGIVAETSIDAPQRYSIWDFLDNPAPMVLAIIGQPGSGKTTLMNHVARRIAQTPGRRRPRPVPALIQLRDHVRQATDPTRTLPQLLRESMPTLSVPEPPGWWESRLQRGRCVVLLDGLDEVATLEDRIAITAWINAQISIYPRNQYVVTSRPHGYQTAKIDSAQTLQVRPFTDDQVRRFLHGWYAAVERRATGTAGREVEMIAQAAADDLLTRLASTPALYDLTANPLLLTMIANVHRYRGSLPGSRADLYGEVCQVMLWRRQVAKKMAVEIPGSSKERLLANLAHRMMLEHAVVLPRRQVLDEIRPGLQRISTAVEPEGFLADVGSNGLLVEREKNLFAFAHLTFQEFLAARYIQEHNLGHQLLDRIDDGWWRETTLLYVAGADADPIVRACLADGSTAALSLAFECADTGPELEPKLRRRLSDTLTVAFRDGADPEHRRLVAGVLAARQLREVITSPDGATLCAQPVTARLYWLFLQEHRVPPPDGQHVPGPDPGRPAAGIWARDARALLAWINSIAIVGSAMHRLPTRAELDEAASRPGPAAHLLKSRAYSVWCEPGADGARDPTLWTMAGRRSPRAVTEAELIAVTAQDITVTHLLDRLLAESICACADALVATGHRAARCAASLSRSITAVRNRVVAADTHQDLTAAANVVRGLIRDLARDRDTAVALARALGLVAAPALGGPALRGVGQRLDRYRDQEIIRHLTQAASLERDISLGVGWSQDGLGLVHANDNARALSRALARARARAAALADAAGDAPAAAGTHPLESALCLGRTPGTRADPTADTVEVLATVMGEGLAPTVLATLQHQRTDRSTPAVLLARHLCGPWTAEANERVVDLDRLAGAAREALASPVFDESDWAAHCAQRLLPALRVFDRTEAITNHRAALIRLPSLALAAFARERLPQRQWPYEAMRELAYGATLLQIRAKHPESLETVLFARTR